MVSRTLLAAFVVVTAASTPGCGLVLGLGDEKQPRDSGADVVVDDGFESLDVADASDSSTDADVPDTETDTLESPEVAAAEVLLYSQSSYRALIMNARPDGTLDSVWDGVGFSSWTHIAASEGFLVFYDSLGRRQTIVQRTPAGLNDLRIEELSAPAWDLVVPLPERRYVFYRREGPIVGSGCLRVRAFDADAGVLRNPELDTCSSAIAGWGFAATTYEGLLLFGKSMFDDAWMGRYHAPDTVFTGGHRVEPFGLWTHGTSVGTRFLVTRPNNVTVPGAIVANGMPWHDVRDLPAGPLRHVVGLRNGLVIAVREADVVVGKLEAVVGEPTVEKFRTLKTYTSGDVKSAVWSIVVGL